MTTDLETDLRREFDAARPPSRLTFSPESIVSQGRRSIRRRRLMTSASTAVAVALVVVGSTLISRPHDSVMPPPATRTTTTGIVRDGIGFGYGTYGFDFDRDVSVAANVRLSFETPDGRRHELGSFSAGKPGQKPDATWRSGIVNGQPVTMGLVPGADQSVTVTFANGASYGISAGPLKGTGYTMFVVDYQEFNAKGKKPAQPEKIVSVSWSGQSGAVDGIEGDHRLTGRVLALSQTHSVEVVLRPAAAGRTTAFGSARLTDDGSFFSAATPLSLATTDPSGAAVITGRRPVVRMTNIKGVPSKAVFDDGPLAAGVLPRGSSDIGVDLTTGKVAAWRAVSERLPDGSVIFAISGTVGLSTDPSRDSITAVTWTNPDGTRGRIAVSQKPSDMAHTYR